MRLVLRKSDSVADWYVIERDGVHGEPTLERRNGILQLIVPARISDADVEGTLAEMRSLALAIRERSEVQHKRCAVSVRANGVVAFCSPRNSMTEGIVSLAEADDLATQIEATAPDGARREG